MASKKLTAHVLAWVMVLSPLVAIAPSVTAHTSLRSGGTYTVDADASDSLEDDHWTTAAVEWGTIGANIEFRHIEAGDLGLTSSGGPAPYNVEDEVSTGLILCNPAGTAIEANSENDVDPEDDDEDNDDPDFENVNAHEDVGVWSKDPWSGTPPFLRGDGEAFWLNLQGADGDGDEGDEDQESAGFNTVGDDVDTLDDNEDGEVSRSELQDAADEGDAFVPTARTIFEDVDIDMNGVWYVVSDTVAADDTDCGTGVDAPGSALQSGFLVEAASELDVTIEPGTITFEYDNDEDEPEIDDADWAINVKWGGDALENAEVTIFDCDRARPAWDFCDDWAAGGAADGGDDSDAEVGLDPDPVVVDDLTDSSGSADYDEAMPGAGEYLVTAICILQDDDDEYIADPEDIADATHECVEPTIADLEGVDNPEDVPDLDADGNDAAGEIEADELAIAHQLRGNTTLVIEPGELFIEQVKGDRPIEDRESEVVWEIRYCETCAFVLSDNTHGTAGGDDPENIYANANTNFTLDITLPDGNHVLMNYDISGTNGAEVTDGDAEDDGILECVGAADDVPATDCDLGVWTMLSAEDVTDCELFSGDDYDCPVADDDLVTPDPDADCDTHDVLGDLGDVDVITLPEDEDDCDTGLDPTVYVGAISARLNPAIDEEDPDEAGFNVIDDPEENDDDLDRRLGYLSVFVPWAAGSYRFELRVNSFSDEAPEFVGTWTLSVASAPEFGFEEVEPVRMDVPARVDNSGILPSDSGWEEDPVEDVDPEFDDDLDDSESDSPFAYVLAFRITDQDGNDVNAYPCHGEEQDGETIEADDAGLPLDDTDDDIDFVPIDGDDRECANFDGVDDLTIEGDLLYDIRDEWIVETELTAGVDPLVPDSLEACLDLADRTASDLGLGGENEFFDPETDTDPLEGDETMVPVYCVYNVVPASPTPVVVHAMIDGQDFSQAWNVSSGGFARVTQVTATAEADGSIRVSLTDMDGEAVSADWQLFEREDFPAEGGEPVTDEDGDRMTASGSTATFDISEDDEVEAGEYAVYAIWDAGDNSLDYAYARVNIEPASDLVTDVTPKRVTAGVPTDFTVTVEEGEEAYEVYFLTHYDFMQVQRHGVAYVEDDEYHPGDFDVDEEDRFDFDFGGAESDEEELTLKAEGPYHVYVRNSDETHDNNGTMPVVEVVPPKVVFTPGRVPFALEEDADVTVSVEDGDGHDINGTLRVVYDVDSEYYTSNDYGFAELTGSDIDNDPSEDDEEWGCWDDDDDAEDADGDDYEYTYLEYRDTGAATDDLDTEMDAGCAGLPEINVDDGEAQLRVTGEDTGPINWTFMHEDEDDLWVNTTGALEIVPPGITVQPDRLIAGQGADVTVTITDLDGSPVEDMLVALCGAPIATVTTCTGVSSTGGDGKAILSVSPTGTGRLEVWIHEPVSGEEEGDCDLEEEDFANIDPTTGLFLTAEDADEVDADCDTDDDLEFDDTDVFVQVVATQSLLRVTVPDTVSVGAASNIAVSVNNAPRAGATVTVTGPTGAQVFSGTTNAAGQVSFTPAAEGTYSVRATATGLQDGTASFRAVTGPVDTVSTFSVTEFAISPTSVMVGDTVEAKATITNTGAERGTANVVLLVNGAQRATQAVTLGPGESQIVAFDFTPSLAGTARLVIKAGSAASQEQALTVTARQPGTDAPTPDEPRPGVPGFEAILAIAALGAAVVAVRRKK